jgi:hypothetical protein
VPRVRSFLCVVLAVLALAACGSSRGTRLGGVRDLEVAAGAQGRASTPVAAAAGSLAPGDYYTALFEPTFTYTVPSGWQLLAESEGVVVLSREVAGQPQGLIITILSPVRTRAAVLDDPITRPSEERRALVRRSVSMPEEYLAYLASQSLLTVSEAEPATLLGRDGSVADVAVTDRPGDLPCPATTSCLALLLERQPVVIHHGFFQGERERVWDVGAGADRLIAMVRVSASAALLFDQLVQDALDVVSSIEFD